MRAGTVAHFAAATPPTGWLVCTGAAVPRSLYGALFLAIGTTYGAGDGSTTFNLPDLRGEFLRGLDSGRGVDTGRAIGTAQADGIRSHNHALGLGLGESSLSPGPPTIQGAGSATTQNTGGAETRPRNVAMLPCIRF